MIDLNRIYQGDVLAVLKTFPDDFVQCVVTSPPYWGLRDYGVAGQLGLEKTPEGYVEKMTEVFREVRRVLKKDGTLWMNLGDSYWNGGGEKRDGGHGFVSGGKQKLDAAKGMLLQKTSMTELGLKPKDLVGIPWRVAFALQSDGWYLRSDIIWAKPNPMPESVTDRPTKAHEYLFLMAKSERYHYDATAIKEKATYGVPNSPESIKSPCGQSFTRAAQKVPTGWDTKHNGNPLTGRFKNDKQRGHGRRHAGFNDRWDQMTHAEQCSGYRNKRSVWTISTCPFPEAHFATFPERLVEPCILAGSGPGGGVVLDPFMGAGTTAVVAKRLKRSWLGIELNPAYIEIANRRIAAEPWALIAEGAA